MSPIHFNNIGGRYEFLTIKKFRHVCGAGALSLALLFPGASAWAGPIISIDLNPGMAGIQTTLTVDPGDTFTIDVVITGDGVMGFDSAAFDVAFNDLGAVLGLAGGTGMPTAGALAGTAPGFFGLTLPGEALDIFGLGVPAVAPGGALGTDAFPVLAGFAGGIRGVGLLAPGPGPGFPLGGPFPTIGLGTTIGFFSLTFDALAAGTSTVDVSTGGGLGGLASGGGAVGFTTASATVTVTPSSTRNMRSSRGLACSNASRRAAPGRDRFRRFSSALNHAISATSCPHY